MLLVHRPVRAAFGAFTALVVAVATLAVLAGPASASASGYLYSGFYTAAIETGGDVNALRADYDALEQWSGRRPALGGGFLGVDNADAGTAGAFKMERVWQARALPFMNIEIQARASAVAAGQFDNQIRAWAQGIKREYFDKGQGRAAILAPLQEMNGNWTQWGCDPAAYQAAYRRIRDIVMGVGLNDTQVRWSFAPNGFTSQGCGGIGSYFPGHDVVDVVGFSSYNYGTKNWDRRQWGPGEVFGPWLDEIRQFWGGKPVIVAQTGTSPEAGRDQWLRDTFAYLAAQPDVVGVLYFNLDKSMFGGNEWDWRIWNGASGDRTAGGLQQAMNASHTLHAHPLASWFQSGKPIPLTPDDLPDGPVERVAGSGRIQTAVGLSQRSRPSAQTVLLARADQYPDALAGGPLAVKLEAPLLLTGSASLDPNTLAEIQRLGARNVIILGGAGAVSEDVAADLRARGYEVERLSGPNRFETARQIALRLGSGDGAYVVEGLNPDASRGWPDAVAVGALAAHQGRPILLVTRDSVPAATQAAFADLGITQATIVGGTGAVSQAVQGAIQSFGVTVGRIASDTRFNTSKAVADLAAQSGLDPRKTWFATGGNYPDALAAAPAVAAGGGILLLVEGSSLSGSPGARVWLDTHKPDSVVLVGGGGAISLSVEYETRWRTGR